MFLATPPHDVATSTLCAGLWITVEEATETEDDVLVMLSKGIAYAMAEGTEPLVKRLYQQVRLHAPLPAGMFACAYAIRWEWVMVRVRIARHCSAEAAHLTTNTRFGGADVCSGWFHSVLPPELVIQDSAFCRPVQGGGLCQWVEFLPSFYALPRWHAAPVYCPLFHLSDPSLLPPPYPTGRHCCTFLSPRSSYPPFTCSPSTTRPSTARTAQPSTPLSCARTLAVSFRGRTTSSSLDACGAMGQQSTRGGPDQWVGTVWNHHTAHIAILVVQCCSMAHTSSLQVFLPHPPFSVLLTFLTCAPTLVPSGSTTPCLESAMPEVFLPHSPT